MCWSLSFSPLQENTTCGRAALQREGDLLPGDGGGSSGWYIYRALPVTLCLYGVRLFARRPPHGLPARVGTWDGSRQINSRSIARSKGQERMRESGWNKLKAFFFLKPPPPKKRLLLESLHLSVFKPLNLLGLSELSDL